MELIQKESEEESALQQEASSAAERFGFAAVKARIPDPPGNSVFIEALTPEGKKLGLFLKCWNREPHFQIWLSFQLRANGFKELPLYYKAENSHTVVSDSGRYWTCQPYIEHDLSYDWLNFNCSPQHCFQAGETLAALHSTGSKALRTNSPPGPHSSADTFNAFPLKFAGTVEKLNDHYQGRTASAQTAKQAGIVSTLKAETFAILQRLPFEKLIKKSSDLAMRLSRSESETAHTVNHGDFHPGNLLFSKDGIPAVIDWEYACTGNGLYDLSYALFMFCLDPQEVDISGQLFSTRKTEAFLDGYSRENSSVKIVKRLNLYSEFVYLLMLDWVCCELLTTRSNSAEHQGFLNLTRSLVLCSA